MDVKVYFLILKVKIFKIMDLILEFFFNIIIVVNLINFNIFIIFILF